MINRKRIFLALGAAVLLLMSLASERRANISIAMQKPGDRAPQKVEAAVDLGVFAVSVLVTWSRRLAY